MFCVVQEAQGGFSEADIHSTAERRLVPGSGELGEQVQGKSPHGARIGRARRVGGWSLTAIGGVLTVALLFGLVGSIANRALAGPPPAMFGFVPLPADQFQDALDVINPAANDTLDFTVGITVASHSAVVYYDHWEDGYEADIANSTQASTQVWGDGNAANGDASTVCTTCPGDLLTAGDVFVLRNNITTPRNPAEIRWDGRDKVASTRGFSMTSGGWTTPLGSVLAGVVSAFDTSRYGTSFLVPVGQDTPFPSGSSPAFEYTGASIMAAQPATNVQVDTNADGAFDTTQTIGQGESLFVNGGLSEGARIVSDKPVQVHLMTGDINATYEAHFFTLVPTPLLANNYVSPVAGPAAYPTIIYLFNPNPSAITVTPTCTSCTGTISVPAGASTSFIVPGGEAVQFTSGGPVFTAVGAMGAQSGAGGDGSTDFSSVFDWGFTLVPANILTTQVVLGWAPGAADLPPSSAAYDPVWVTTFDDTTLSVDFDADPTTGALSGDCIGQHDVEIPVTALASTLITDSSDNSMTGARIYTCDGATVAAAWGEDPAAAPTGHPGLDAGYTVIPTTTILVNKTSTLAIDSNGDSKIGPGDTLEYSAMVSNAGGVQFTNAVVEDTLLAGLNYVPGTTVLDNGTTITPVADDTVPPSATPFPLDEGGLGVPNVAPGETLFVRFRSLIDNPWTAPSTTVTNTVNVTTDQGGGSSTDVQPLAVADLSVTKSETAAPTFVGDNAVFEVVISNDGPDTAPDVELTDLLPADATYQSHTVSQGSYVPGTGVWTVGDIADAASATLTITARLEDTSVQNVAEVTLSGAADPDSTPGNGNGAEDDQDGVTVNVSPRSDLSLTKARTAGPDVNGNTTYRITVANDGPSGATGIEVTELPPSGAAFVSAAPSQGSFDSNTGVWAVGAVGAAATATLDVTYDVPSFPASNFAEITAADQSDPDSEPGEDPLGPSDPPNQDDEAEVSVTLSSDLSVQKAVTTAPEFVGDDAVFTITVTNDGPDPADSVVVTDLVPAGLSYVAHNASSGAYVPGTGEWTLDPIATGTSETLEITARVMTPGTITNTAELTASGAPDPDSTPDNDDPTEDDQDSDSVTTTGASLGDSVFFDVNHNGAADPGEPGIAGVDVTVIDPGPNGTLGDGDDVALPTVTTDASGAWAVTGLGPATYRVSIDVSTLPNGITDPTFDVDGVGTANVADAAVTGGQTRTDVDFGYTGTATIGDRVFLDFNGDGLFDDGEGIADVDVDLVWAGFDGTLGNGDDIAFSATSDANGAWSVPSLPAGLYEVTVDQSTLPEGLTVWTDPDGGADATSQLTVTSGETDLNQDFGFLGMGEVGHLIFEDDGGEPGGGIAGVTVELTWAGPDGSFGGGDDHTYSASTDGNGEYRIGNLPAGTYRVTILTSTLPEGSTNTVDPDGGNDSESQLTLAISESDLAQNFGYDVPSDAPPGTPATPATPATPSNSGGGSLALTGSGVVNRMLLVGMSMSITGLGLVLASRPGRCRRMLAYVIGR